MRLRALACNVFWNVLYSPHAPNTKVIPSNSRPNRKKQRTCQARRLAWEAIRLDSSSVLGCGTWFHSLRMWGDLGMSVIGSEIRTESWA